MIVSETGKNSNEFKRFLLLFCLFISTIFDNFLTLPCMSFLGLSLIEC